MCSAFLLGCYWVLFYRVSLSMVSIVGRIRHRFTGFDLVFLTLFFLKLGFTGFVLGFSFHSVRCYTGVLGFPSFYWVLLGFTGFYWVLLDFTVFY